MSSHPKFTHLCEDCSGPFEGTAPARYCPDCRWRHRGRKPEKYVWTEQRDAILRARYDSRIKGRAAEIAAKFGWPRWVITRRAAALGLTFVQDRKDWTQEEVDFLWQHVGRRTTHWMAKKLGRGETSVVLKLKRMKISRRFRDGYTLRELVLCFGTDHHVIERWVADGKLNVRKRGTRRARDAWYVSDADILRFIQDHPMTFELRKVDQFWFVDLITGGALVRKALAIESAVEDEDDEREEAIPA